MSMSFEPLGASGSASDNEFGRWLLWSDVLCTRPLAPGHAVPPLRSFPQDWPAVFSASPALKRLINKRLKGARCRAVAPLAPSEGGDEAAKVAVHAHHSFRNAQRLHERLGWPVVRGWRIFEIADDVAGESFVALRWWWNATTSGAWADLTPPLLPDEYGGGTERRSLLVEPKAEAEAELLQKAECALTAAVRREATQLVGALMQAAADGLVGSDADRAVRAGDAALAASDVEAALCFYSTGQRAAARTRHPPAVGQRSKKDKAGDETKGCPPAVALPAGLRALLEVVEVIEVVERPTDAAASAGEAAAQSAEGEEASCHLKQSGEREEAGAPAALAPLDVSDASPAQQHHAATSSTAAATVGESPSVHRLTQLALGYGLARCHVELADYWEAALTADIAIGTGVLVGGPEGALIAKLQMLFAEAASRLGLLSLAIELIGQPCALPDPPDGAQALYGKVQQRVIRSEAGEAAAVAAEVRTLRAALGDGEASKWQRSVDAEMVTRAGRQRLRESGFLSVPDAQLEHDTQFKAASERALHKALLYHTKKRLQQSQTLAAGRSADADGATTGGTYRCLPPNALVNRLASSPMLPPTALDTLRRERLCTVDDAIEPSLATAAAKEMRWLIERGVLRSDSDDVCNPLQRSFDVPIWDTSVASHVAKDCPALAQCIARLFNLPQLLHESLGHSLRCPQTVMLAAYPTGAHYRRHFDSYGGRDIPRFFTALLYLGWTPRAGGSLRAYAPTHDPPQTPTHSARRPADDKAPAAVWPDGSAHRDIEPVPGRLCVFYAQEVEHEVLPSVGERYAITLWIWSTEKDDKGR